MGDDFDAIAGLSSLDDPVRRRLYEYVASCDEPVVREDAAAAVGISRTLAAYHLDKLADVGILSVSYARPEGRSGPGAGRPAKRYARTHRELSASVPPRNYGLLATLLTEAVAADTSGTVGAAVAAMARRAGRTSASTNSGHTLIDALIADGYEPVSNGDGDVVLRNCPFHQLARQHPELVCGLNLQLVQGMCEAAGDEPERAVLDPADNQCCVVVRTPQHPRKKIFHRRAAKTPTRRTQGRQR